MMLSLEDCIALSSLTEEEIAAIAEHEHLPMIVAAELGNYLVQTPEGSHSIKKMIGDDIQASRARGDLQHVLVLKLVLRHYLSCHPECTGMLKPPSAQNTSAIRHPGTNAAALRDVVAPSSGLSTIKTGIGDSPNGGVERANAAGENPRAVAANR